MSTGTISKQTTPRAHRPVRLLVPREEATSQLERELKIAKAILNQRIGSSEELVLARTEKQEWIQRTQELMLRLFDNPIIAQKCNDWVPIILPEYAEFQMFVDVFAQEMRYRVGRMKSVLKALRELPEAVPEPQGAETFPEMELAHVEQTMIQKTYVKPTVNPVPDPAPEPVAEPIAKPIAEPAVVAADPRPASPAPAEPPSGGGVLISLGTHQALRDRVAAFCEKIGLPLAVIERQADSNVPLIDELTSRASATFALVLGSPPADGACYWFDLGCCAGRLGSGRVMTIGAADHAAPAVRGITHLALDGGEGWQLQLARHLRRSGVEVDLNRLV